jgi:ribose-phosphate pyrophosphokinase
MTTLAVTQPPLRRLFERLDFAPAPQGAAPKAVLEAWKAARRGVAPALRDLGDVEGGFVFRRVEGERDYALVSGETAARTLIGALAPGARLCAAGDLRGAARLRRLFDETLRVGEPALVEYTLVEDGRDSAMVELVAAPLALEDASLGAVLGSACVRRFRHPAPARPARAPFDESFALFALGSSRGLGEAVASALGVALAPHEERGFEDGERKIRPLLSVRGLDVHVVSSLHGEPGRSGADKLVDLLFFVGALRDGGAASVTAVVPYLCYARKDRRTKPHDPVSTRYVAQLLEAVGTTRIVAIDAHNIAAFENAFRIETAALDARSLFACHFVREIGEAPLAVVSPDLGGEKRAELFRQRLEARLGRTVAKGFMDKHRSMGRVTGEIFAGEVAGRAVVILDDLIASGGTMARTAAACRANGASRIFLAATHGLFSTGAVETLRDAPVEKIVVTDSVPVSAEARESLGETLVVLGVAELLARAIERLRRGGALDDAAEAAP